MFTCGAYVIRCHLAAKFAEEDECRSHLCWLRGYDDDKCTGDVVSEYTPRYLNTSSSGKSIIDHNMYELTAILLTLTLLDERLRSVNVSSA